MVAVCPMRILLLDFVQVANFFYFLSYLVGTIGLYSLFVCAHVICQLIGCLPKSVTNDIDDLFSCNSEYTSLYAVRTLSFLFLLEGDLRLAMVTMRYKTVIYYILPF